MTPFSWLCPYCNQIATITENNVSTDTHQFDRGNKEKRPLALVSSVVVCPNSACHEYCVEASLYLTRPTGGGGRMLNDEPFLSWKLRPRSAAKPLPAYVPLPIRTDYEEACQIADLSPKASATLARRCLQGIIRDFWGISKSRLIDEIAELHGTIDSSTWLLSMLFARSVIPALTWRKISIQSSTSILKRQAC